MNVENVKVFGWEAALDAARTTMRKQPLDKMPSEQFRREMLRCEHSPLRLVQYSWIWRDIPYWVSVHMVRHHIGCEKFVSTSRPDRVSFLTGEVFDRGDFLTEGATADADPRHALSQSAPVDMMMACNAQALINISRLRLCGKASKETRQAWRMALDAIKEIDPLVVEYCVPKCVAKGFCDEPQTCHFCESKGFSLQRNIYINQ